MRKLTEAKICIYTLKNSHQVASKVENLITVKIYPSL